MPLFDCWYKDGDEEVCLGTLPWAEAFAAAKQLLLDKPHVERVVPVPVGCKAGTLFTVLNRTTVLVPEYHI